MQNRLNIGEMARAGRWTPSRMKGFTLMELMLVLVILGILGSLLSAALGQVKSKAHQVTCISNLRQIHVGWLIYVEDHRDALPLNISEPTSDVARFGRRNTTNSWVAGNPKEDLDISNIQKGTIYPNIGNAGVYRCPGDHSKVVGHSGVRRTRSYSMSEFMNGDDSGKDSRVKSFLTDLVSPSPSQIFIFIEEDESSAWTGSFHVMESGKLSISQLRASSSLPSIRHRQGSNLSFADGHVEHWKWQWPETTQLLNSLPTPREQAEYDMKRLESCIPRY